MLWISYESYSTYIHLTKNTNSQLWQSFIYNRIVNNTFEITTSWRKDFNNPFIQVPYFKNKTVPKDFIQLITINSVLRTFLFSYPGYMVWIWFI